MICSGKLQDNSKSSSRENKAIGLKHAWEIFEHNYFVKKR